MKRYVLPGKTKEEFLCDQLDSRGIGICYSTIKFFPNMDKFPKWNKEFIIELQAN